MGLFTPLMHTMPKEQLHKRLTTEQVKAILLKQQAGELTVVEAARYLDLGRTRFYELATAYASDPEHFSVVYERAAAHRLDAATEENILRELATERAKVIDNPEVPTDQYNYSYLRQLLLERYGQSVSVPTIISRAKEHGYWKPRLPKRVHDREVITNYPGELIQHDSSHHRFAPDAPDKWYLITSLDDYSRTLLYADLWLRESSWAHIVAARSVILTYGAPFSYYADQHSIFRYVRDRDKHNPWATARKFTDDVDPQWKLVLKDCGVKPIYALSPQAKGKIERPYRWLQDHLVRSCVRSGVTEIEVAKEILRREVHQYNTSRVHSTTGEIPMVRFERARRENRTLFREFVPPAPLQSMHDVFCLRVERMVDAYRTVSLQGLRLKVPVVPPRHDVELRLVPDMERGVTEIRFWYRGQLVGTQHVKNDDLPLVRF